MDAEPRPSNALSRTSGGAWPRVRRGGRVAAAVLLLVLVGSGPAGAAAAPAWCPGTEAPPPPHAAEELAAAPVSPLPWPPEPVGGPLLAGCADVVAVGAPPPPSVGAESWIVADLDTGAVLAAHAPHVRHRPASTLKVLTALVAISRLDPDTVVEGTAEDTQVDGSRAGIGAGGHYTVRQLLVRAAAELGQRHRERARPHPRGHAGHAGGHDRGRAGTGRAGHPARDPVGARRPGHGDLRVRPRAAVPARDARAVVRRAHRDPRRRLPRVRHPSRLPAVQHRRSARPVSGRHRREDRLHRCGAAHVRRGGEPGWPPSGRGAGPWRATSRPDVAPGRGRCSTTALRCLRVRLPSACWSTRRPSSARRTHRRRASRPGRPRRRATS